MKKLIASISLVCYFAATCGVIVNAHYCMNKLASVHLFEKSANLCGKCGMATTELNGCCHDEVKVIKLEQDQNNTPIVSYDIAPLKLNFSDPSGFTVASYYKVGQQRHFCNHSPPLLSVQDIYLQNNVFRI